MSYEFEGDDIIRFLVDNLLGNVNLHTRIYYNTPSTFSIYMLIAIVAFKKDSEVRSQNQDALYQTLRERLEDH